MDPVKGVSNNPISLPNIGKSENGKESDFLETLKAYYHHVDKEIKEADLKAQEFAVGKRHDLHEIMIASAKADLSFRLLSQIRNKLLEAYKEIMRMAF